MNILVITNFLNGFLMIAMPVGLAFLLTRRWKLGWRIWWIGAATFVLSQVGHIPFNLGIGKLLNDTGLVYWPPLAQQVFNASFLGLSAGIFEEGARYLILRLWAREARSWRTGILFGAGHGGMEAILLGGLVLVTYFSMLAIRGVDLAGMVPEGQLALAQEQVAAYWSGPWFASLLGAVERLFTIPIQIAMALLVLQAVTRKKIGWLLLAILYHAVVDGVTVFLLPTLGYAWTEVLVGGFALVSIVVIQKLKQPEPVIEAEVTRWGGPVAQIAAIEESRENLDGTRFQS